jgi:hypothetical protein
MELTIGECTLDVGDEPTKERRADSNTKLPVTGVSHGYPLPVTKPSEAPSPMPVEKIDGPLATAVADAKEESRGARGANPISKPPASRKLRDSVPPGAS